MQAVLEKDNIAFFRRDETVGKTMTLAGPKAWTVDEVIELCEKYADAEADVSLQHTLCPLHHLQHSLSDCMGIMHTDLTMPLPVTAWLLYAV